MWLIFINLKNNFLIFHAGALIFYNLANYYFKTKKGKMFTFGMFTTHIPYIALVAFYAYFLLFGIEKASKGEILSESQNSFFYETQVSENFNKINSGCFYYHSEDLFTEQLKFENFVFKRKLNRIGFSHNLHNHFLIVPSTANRPPPLLG